ncbi:MAG TPA: ATP-binding protein [Candidatus Binatia bacterium]
MLNANSRPFSFEYALSIPLTVLVTIVACFIEPVAGHAAASSLYLLAVVVAGIRFRRGPVLFVAASSAVAWYTVFIPPRFTFHIGTVEDALVFASFFAVAVAMGHLTSELRFKEIAERSREQRTAALYELVKQAGLAHDLDLGLGAAVKLAESLFGVRAALSLRGNDGQLAAEPHRAGSLRLNEKEYAAAVQAFITCRPAGKFTEVLPGLETMHLPLRARDTVMGVLSILPPVGVVFDSAEREMLDAFTMLIATVVEKDELLQVAKRTEIIAASERLQRALLQSVSHELKTPLAAVQAGIDVLAKEAAGGLRSRVTFIEIQQSLRRLHRVINNLLDMTRIESGVVHPKLDWCDVGDLIEAASDLAQDGVGAHPIVVELDRGLPLVRIDQALIEACVCNLLLNAAAHSLNGTKITVSARVVDGALALTVRDQGRGISAADLPHIFETFYRGAESRPGGAGLGLAIVDGFTRAHGGLVSAANREPRGAEFMITIPVETFRPDAVEKLA